MRVDDFFGDLGYALARLRRMPVFVAAVSLTFALGIGINVAVFSVFNAAVLHPLPFPNASRLVAIDSRIAGRWQGGPLSWPDVSDLRAQTHGIESVAGINATQGTMTINDVPREVSGASVSSTYFSAIGATPEIGRFFEPSDVQSGQHSMVISDNLWRTYFNSDPAVIGKSINLAGTTYVVVGVSRPNLELPNPHPMVNRLQPFDYVTAIPESSESNQRGARFVGVIASLAPNTSLTQLNAELRIASARLQQLYPQSDKNAMFFARPLADQLRSPFASGLFVMLLGVLAILLIACANVANLIATRWSAREREVAIRRALGASTRRIAAQLFIETGVLATCGGIVGIGLAMLALRLIPHTALEMVLPHDIAIDVPTLLYALLMVGVTTIAAGLTPILALGRTDLQLVLNSAGRSGDLSRGGALRSTLVVAEVALALALVITAGLVVRSYVNLLNTPLGIKSDDVYTSAPIQLPTLQYPTEESERLADQQLLSRAQAIPGVDAAALALVYPLSSVDIRFSPEMFGTPCRPGSGGESNFNSVSPGYFRALGIPLLQGRDFAAGDNGAGAPVTIANQAFVNAFLHGSPAIGQKVRRCGTTGWTTIVGVVGNVRLSPGGPAAPTLYWPIAQKPAPIVSLLVHAPHSTVTATENEIQSSFAAALPPVQPPKVYTVAALFSESTKVQRSAATLLGVFSLIPLLLALSGIFGVVSFAVGQRSREFGIRVALGAQAYHILMDVLRRSLSMAAIGVLIGTLLGTLCARAIAPLISVSPLDPLTFGTVIGLVVIAALVAAITPALRAARIDPMTALRYDA